MYRKVPGVRIPPHPPVSGKAWLPTLDENRICLDKKPGVGAKKGMIKHPRIELDASKLLGFKQMKGALPGHLTGQQAKACAVAPEPSTWVELLLGLLTLGIFALRSHFQKKKVQPRAIAGSPAEAGAAGAPSIKE